MTELTVNSLARMIDHTALKPDAVEDDIARLCEEALKDEFFAVCVAPFWVKLAAARLTTSRTVVATVLGFPHGNTLTKASEAELAIANGAVELDMVVNIGELKRAAEDEVCKNIRAVVEVAQGTGCKVKVILETALLSKDEKIAGCRCAEAAGADFVKTSTGFTFVKAPNSRGTPDCFVPAGATVEDVTLLRDTVGDRLGVKASGGIKTLEDARAMITAGATRLGCSGSVAIIEELRVDGGRSNA
jgi:deoxyribose-phosphate aldolase